VAQPTPPCEDVRRAFPLVSLACAALTSSAPAQAILGTYTTQNPGGATITLVLQKDALGRIGGTMTGNGAKFTVQGQFQGDDVVGTLRDESNGGAFFEHTSADLHGPGRDRSDGHGSGGARGGGGRSIGRTGCGGAGRSVTLRRMPFPPGAGRVSANAALEPRKRERLHARLMGNFEWSYYQR